METTGTTQEMWYISAEENNIQQWWQDVQPALSSVYDMKTDFTSKTSRSQVITWLIDCHDSIVFLDQIPTPPDALSTRYNLLEALDNLLKALAYHLADEETHSRAYWHSTCIEFELIQERVYTGQSSG